MHNFKVDCLDDMFSIIMQKLFFDNNIGWYNNHNKKIHYNCRYIFYHSEKNAITSTNIKKNFELNSYMKWNINRVHEILTNNKQKIIH